VKRKSKCVQSLFENANDGNLTSFVRNTGKQLLLKQIDKRILQLLRAAMQYYVVVKILVTTLTCCFNTFPMQLQAQIRSSEMSHVAAAGRGTFYHKQQKELSL